jgi:hypothetical protein
MSRPRSGVLGWAVCVATGLAAYDAKFEAASENPAGGRQRGCVTWGAISQCGVDASGRSLEIELWRTPT